MLALEWDIFMPRRSRDAVSVHYDNVTPNNTQICHWWRHRNKTALGLLANCNNFMALFFFFAISNST